MSHDPTRIDQIAQAVADAINAARWPERVVAKKVDRTTVDLTDLQHLVVNVITGSTTREQFTRGKKRRTYEINIGFRQHMPANEAPRVEQLKNLVALIAEHLDDNALASLPGVNLDSVTDTGPSVETLNDLRTYLQVLTFNYFEFS